MVEGMFVEERRSVILEQLSLYGRVFVKELSETLGVSAVTIRQDLQALEDEGLLRRTYGGAMLARDPIGDGSELSFDVRRSKNTEEKDALGRAAAALVQDGYGIALDASTTVCSIIPYIKHLDSLTVVTNNLLAANLLLDAPRVEVLLPAGKLRRDANSIVGQPDSLPDLNLTIGFFSAWGLSLDEGITEVSPEETAMKQALLAHCLAPVILVDSSKWGKIAPYTYTAPGQIQHVLTTDRAPADLVQRFRAAGVAVKVISTENGLPQQPEK